MIQKICGSGKPDTLHVNAMGDPTLTIMSLKELVMVAESR